MPMSKKQLAIELVTQDVLRTLLRFHVSHSIALYLKNRTEVRYIDFEEELHINYPIRAVGVVATRKNLREIDSLNGGFLRDEEELAPEIVTDHFGDFPLSAVAAAYCFTILEGYGDELVRIVNRAYEQKRRSWHREVHADADLLDPAQLLRARESYARPFGANARRVPIYAVQRLTRLKQSRNTLMHQGLSANIDFEEFYGSIVGTVCQLFFLCAPSCTELTVLPFNNRDDKARPVR